MSTLENQPGARPIPADLGELPSVLVATPADMPEEFDATTPFWLPDRIQSLKLLGWRWVFVLAGAGFFVLAGWLLFFRGRYLVLSLSGLMIKAGAFAIAGMISLWVYLRRGAVRLRKDPFCIHCGYSLVGLADGGICPECGRRYSFRVAQEYKRDPHWFMERYRNRAHVVASGGGLDVPASHIPSASNPDGL
jgi:hypothetical protein